MKTLRVGLIGGALAMLMGAPVLAQTGHDLFQQALVLEQAEGDLRAAIQMYERIAEEFGTDRELVARALVQMGRCHEKLGNSEAQRAYQRVVDEYADQALAAAEARTRLAALVGVGLRSTPSGLLVRRVWRGRGVDYSGDVSADGRYLTYVDWSTGDLAVRDLVAGQNRRLTNKGTWAESDEFADHSTISPNGREVAYSWYNEDFRFEVRVIGLDGLQPRTLYANEQLESIYPADWSPDGRHVLALASHKDDTHEIALLSVDDGSLRVVKNLGWRQPGRMYFSPDGYYIAYNLPEAADSPQRDVYVAAVTGGREARVVAHPADDYLLGWGPSGRHILFASDRSGTVGVWLVRVTDGAVQGDPELIQSDVSRISPIGLTGNGSFHYGLNSSSNDVYVATLDWTTGQLMDPPRRLAEGFEGANSTPEWSPDGRHLAYVSLRGSHDRGARTTYLIIHTLETGAERTLSPQLNGFNNVWGMRWSPDGRFLLALGRDSQNRVGVYRVDVESGDVIPISHGHGACLGPAVWSNDGTTVVCNNYDESSKSSQILAIDVQTGRVQELYSATDSAGFHGPLAISPDGNTLAFRMGRRGDDGPLVSLVTMPLSGGEPRLVVEQVPQSGTVIIEWSPDGRKLIYEERRPDDGQRMWIVPVEGGEPREIDFGLERGAYDFSYGIKNLRIHPEGQHVAFTLGSTEAEVWVMENFLPKGTEDPQWGR